MTREQLEAILASILVVVVVVALLVIINQFPPNPIEYGYNWNSTGAYWGILNNTQPITPFGP